jgi:hypothetical protein
MTTASYMMAHRFSTDGFGDVRDGIVYRTIDGAPDRSAPVGGRREGRPGVARIGGQAEWLRVAGRATGIEGVCTAIEGCLREVLNVTDAGVSGSPDRFHAQVAQAAEQTPDRPAIISADLYAVLDSLRQFQHRERNVYRHLLVESGVNENLQRLKVAFPKFESQVAAFVETWERTPG